MQRTSEQPQLPSPSSLCSTLAQSIGCLIPHRSSGLEFTSLRFFPVSELWNQQITPTLGVTTQARRRNSAVTHMALPLAARPLKPCHRLSSCCQPEGLPVTQKDSIQFWQRVRPPCKRDWGWGGWGRILTRFVEHISCPPSSCPKSHVSTTNKDWGCHWIYSSFHRNCIEQISIFCVSLLICLFHFWWEWEAKSDC